MTFFPISFPPFFIFISSPFWFVFGISLVLIRWLADGSPRLRFYWENGRPWIMFGLKRKFSGKHLHIHHFIWGIPSFMISLLLALIGFDLEAQLLGGFASALWFSELKELINMKWGR
jgi:hypothetical protein